MRNPDVTDVSYQTKWIPGPVASQQSFLWKSLWHHGLRAAPRLLFSRRRSPSSVRSSYDAFRQTLLDTLERVDWDTYIRFSPDLYDFVLLNDRVVWESLRTARTHALERLASAVALHARPGATVIEFGSGDGRNLLFLQRKFPELSFIGLELSPTSVEVSRRAAEKFQLPQIRFQIANVCEVLPPLPPRSEVVLSFSSFALEMMPRIFGRAVDRMADCSSDGVLFLEPVGELWSRDLRGVASRLRIVHFDRLRGLAGKASQLIRSGEWMSLRMERSKLGLNPLNEMCEIHLRRVERGPGAN